MSNTGVVGKTVLAGVLVVGLMSTGVITKSVHASSGVNVVVTKVAGNEVNYKTDSGKVLNAELETVSVTAGITGVTVTITGDKKAKETDVLTSIYSTYEKSVQPLNAKRKKLATDELRLMSDISASKNVKGSKGKGNVQELFVKVKEEMFKQAKLDTTLTDKEIDEALQSSYKKTKLDKALTKKQKKGIKGFALQYRDLELVKNDVIPEQLRDISNYTTVGVGETLEFTGNAVKERAEGIGFVDGVKNFFSELMDSLKSFFSKDEE